MFEGKAISEMNQKLDHILCHIHEEKDAARELNKLKCDIKDDVAIMAARLRTIRYNLINAIPKEKE